MKNSRILIVGGNGYLGKHLSNKMDTSNHIFITGTQKLNIDNYFQIDFDNLDTYKVLEGNKFDLVIILAAKISGIGKVNLDNDVLHSNTFNYSLFLEYIKSISLTDKIIFSSSMTVYAKQNTIPVIESGNLSPLSVYGLSKMLAENITSFFCNTSDIKGLTLRLPGIYGGDRNSGIIYNTAKKCLEDKEIILNTQGLGYWETIEVNDLCHLIVSLMCKYKWEKSYETINVCYGERTDICETAD
ncbi:MAG: NAD(P)-dependent oxidoreductase, partial [Bacteroidota bacterium]